MTLHSSNNMPTPDKTPSRFQVMAKKYRRANKAAWYLPSIVIGTFFLGCLIFSGAYLSLRYIVSPNISQYKGNIERLATLALGKKVSISHIDTAWDGIHANLNLNNVEIQGVNKTPLQLKRISATLAWESLLVFDLRLAKLELFQPNLHIRRDKKGQLFVADFPFTPSEKKGSPSADWILKQHEIVIYDGTIQWEDKKRHAAPLVLNNINFSIKNAWRSHTFQLSATPPAEISAPFKLKGDFNHPFFTDQISNLLLWKGELDASLSEVDLDALKIYFDYPFKLKKGTGSIRLWLALEQGKLMHTTVDLNLSDVRATLRRDLPELNLKSVKGQVSADSNILLNLTQDRSAWKEEEHTLSLTNFSYEMENGEFLPDTTASLTVFPKADASKSMVQISATKLNLGKLADFTRHLPLTNKNHRVIKKLAPQGILNDFVLRWYGSYKDPSRYAMTGGVSKLSLGTGASNIASLGIPRFKNLSGHIDVTESSGSLLLDSENFQVHLPKYFESADKHFDTLQLEAAWSQKENTLDVNVNKLQFSQGKFAANISGKQQVHLEKTAKKRLGDTHFSGSLSNFSIKTIGDYLPLQMASSARKWLSHALEGGTVPKGSFLLKSNDLTQFPFAKQAQTGSIFNLTLELEDAKLNYRPDLFAADKTSPLWPQSEEINGRLTINNGRLTVFGKTAKTNGVKLQNVTATIPNLISKDMALQIKGTASGELQKFIHYTQITPVAKWINHFTSNTKTQGDATLELDFNMPLTHAIDTKVNGELIFKNNRVDLIRDLPTLSSTQGSLRFNEKGFNLDGISATFLGGQVKVRGGTEKNGKFNIYADGRLTDSGLRKAYLGLPNQIHGHADYTVNIKQKPLFPDITLYSNLKGLGLNYPAPLFKAKAAVLPLNVLVSAISPEPNSEVIASDQIQIRLGKNIKAHYIRQKMPHPESRWKVARGGISVNTETFMPSKGLLMSLNLPSLSIGDWQSALVETPSGQKKTSEVNFSQYVMPRIFLANVQKLSVAGLELNKANLNVRNNNDAWSGQLASHEASGDIQWRDLNTTSGAFNAKLSHLTIAENSVSHVKENLNSNSTDSVIPALNIDAEKFTLFEKEWGKLALNVHNTRTADGRVWKINQFSINNENASLSTSGEWRTKNEKHLTDMTYALELHNAGKLLTNAGYPDFIADGNGIFKGRARWHAPPFSPELATLSGEISLNIKSGQFLKASPGAARIFTLLSLESLVSRLTLDFRDVFAKGFAFKELSANATIDQGVVNTNNLKMHGVNAAVALSGTTNLIEETQDLHLVVIPEISAGGAALLYSFVNPVVGLSTFLAQFILQEPLKKVLTYEYQVTGTMKSPKITVLKKETVAPKQEEPIKLNIKQEG